MQLSDVIEAYLSDREARGIGPGTRRNDKQVLGHLLADVGNISTRNLRPQHIDRFWVRRTTWAQGTKNRARYSLKAFFEWCQARNHIARDLDLLPEKVRYRVTKRDRVLIPQTEFSTWLSSISDPRRRIVIALGLYLFTRVSETRTLRWQDYNHDTQTIEVYRHKTDTLDTLPVCMELAEELRRWRRNYAYRTGQHVEPGWFIVPGCEPIRRSGIKGLKGFQVASDTRYIPDRPAALGHVLTEELTRAGYYQRHEGGHTLRRSGAVALYYHLADIGHDRAIRICQGMLGHASIRTTEIYLRLDLDRKVRNDLLAGKPMFPAREGTVIHLERDDVDGQAHTGSI